jgi:membrane protease YdiL (CAAX protease family)
LLVTNIVGGGKTQLDALIESSYQARIIVAFLAFATAPLVEEVVYRGILYPALQRALGVAWAIIIVSSLFAGVHVLQYYNNIGVIIVITILSITLTSIRAWSGRLLPTVVIHLIFNGIQSLILVFEPLVRKSEKITPSIPGFSQLSTFLNHLF